MGLAVFAVLRSELQEVPLLGALVQVVADAVELVLGPAAGHDAQRPAKLRSQPSLHGRKVSGSHDKYRLVLAGMEQGGRGYRAGISQVTEVIGELDVTAALGHGPTARGRRARGRHPPGMRCGRLDGRVLPLDPELLTGPGTGHSRPALHQAILLETTSHSIEVRACDPDCAPPHGPDPALQAPRRGDQGLARTSHPGRSAPAGQPQLPDRLHAPRGRQHPCGQVITPSQILALEYRMPRSAQHVRPCHPIGTGCHKAVPVHLQVAAGDRRAAVGFGCPTGVRQLRLAADRCQAEPLVRATWRRPRFTRRRCRWRAGPGCGGPSYLIVVRGSACEAASCSYVSTSIRR